MAKSNGKNVQNRTPKKGAFLEEFARSGNIAHAAKIAGIGRQTHYDWINPELSKDAEEYRAMFEDAKHDAIAVLELEARRRATDGVVRIKFHKGERFEELQYSDTLLIFLLKGNAPEKYRERYEVQHAGEIDVNHNIRIVQDDDWYENSDRLLALTTEASGSDSDEQGKVQAGRRRKKMGKNGNGSASGD